MVAAHRALCPVAQVYENVAQNRGRIDDGPQNVAKPALEKGLGRRSLRPVWVFGFFVMLAAWVMLLDRLTSIRHGNGEMSPFLLVPFSLVGALMMLFGAGEWGRWGYLLVFLAIPVSFSLLFLIPSTSKGYRRHHPNRGGRWYLRSCAWILCAKEKPQSRQRVVRRMVVQLRRRRISDKCRTRT
jgi:hypothetical protein